MEISGFAKEIAELYHKGQIRKNLKAGQVKFKNGTTIPVEGIEEPEPYVHHPIRVVGILHQFFVNEHNKTQPGGKQYSILTSAYHYEDISSEVYFAAGYLHDVLEDCATASELKLTRLFYEELSKSHNLGEAEEQVKTINQWHRALKAVLLLTKQHRQSYVTYLMKIKKDPVAKLVKLADLADNMSDLEVGCSLYQKYELTKFVLQNPYEQETDRK